MPFELFFGSLGATVDLTEAGFREHFAGRAHVTVGSRGALYENPATGVTFAFQVLIPPEVPIRKFVGYARFQADFLRPGFFATEATREIGAFVAATGYDVYDAQRLELPPGAWAPREFLTSWDDANRALLRGMGHYPPLLPRTDLLHIWRWNYARPSYAAQLGPGYFVPPVTLIDDGTQVRTAVVWNGELRAALPKVDVVLMPRQRQAKRGLLRRKQEDEDDMGLAEWRQVAPFVTAGPVRREPGVHYLLDYEAPPEGLLRLIDTLPGTGRFQPLGMDEVLDEEAAA